MRTRSFTDTLTLAPTDSIMYHAPRVPFPRYLDAHPSSPLPPPLPPPPLPSYLLFDHLGLAYPPRVFPPPPDSLTPQSGARLSPLSSPYPTAAEGAVATKETPDPVAADAATAGVSAATAAAASSAQLSSRQRNRLEREVRAGAAAAAGAPPFAAKAKRRRGGEDGNDADGNRGGGGGGASEREDGPPAFLGRARGMMDVAGDARGALVSLAADLVTQVG